MKLEKKYCLYFHLKKGTNIVFYVGIGDKYRPFVDLDRSKLWHRTANKYGYYVIIKHTNIDWYNACKLEIAWIKKIGRRDKGLGTLVNLTNGGDGVIGYEYTKEQNKENSRKLKEYYKINKHPATGNKRPDLAERNRNKVWTKEERKNHGKFNLGNTYCLGKKRPDVSERMKKIDRRGRKNLMYGRKRPDLIAFNKERFKDIKERNRIREFGFKKGNVPHNKK